jgi:hypothetical protein
MWIPPVCLIANPSYYTSNVRILQLLFQFPSVFPGESVIFTIQTTVSFGKIIRFSGCRNPANAGWKAKIQAASVKSRLM